MSAIDQKIESNENNKDTGQELNDLKLDNLSTKAKNILESVNTIITSFKDKLTENSKAIIGIVEMLRSFNLFDSFFNTVNDDGTPNQRNIAITGWLENIYETEYSLQKEPYLGFLENIKDENNFKSEIFLESDYLTATGIQSKIDNFLSDDTNKTTFKNLFSEKIIKGVIDKDLLATLLKDNTAGLVVSDFFDDKGEILESVDESKLNSLIDIIFADSNIKKSLGTVAGKFIDNFLTDSTNDKRIKSDQDIAFWLFATICKPSYTENVALYNTLPSSLVVEEVEEVDEVEKVEEVQEVEEVEEEEIQDGSDLANNEKFIKIVREHIFETESKGEYGAVYKNDGGSASIGLIQRNWNAGNAPELLKKMYEKNSDLFDKNLSGSSWYDKFIDYKNGGSDRKGAIWSDEDVIKFKDFMTDQDMKDVMDEEVDDYVKKYIKNCLDNLITDTKMIVYLCRLQNFGPVVFNDIVELLDDKASFKELNEKTIAYMEDKALTKPAYVGKADHYNQIYEDLSSQEIDIV